MPRAPKTFVNYNVRVEFGGGPSPGLRKAVLARIAMLLDNMDTKLGIYGLPGVEHHYVTEIGFAARVKSHAKK